MATSFEEKYNICRKSFENLKGNPDYPKEQLNFYADHIELLALLSRGDGISYGDIQDSFFGQPDEKSNAENNDNEEYFIRQIFSLIDERIKLFQGLYPFEKMNNSLFLKTHISDNEKYYLFLLFSSMLNIFGSFQSDLTKDFETLSFEVLKKYLPNATIKKFGNNSDYHGNAKQKIIALSNDLGIPYDKYEISQIGERNNQERGLDVIGWLPFGDKCQNKVVFLGQCACGKNFESKQHDTRRFEEYLKFYKTKPQHTLFIPYSLINVKEGKFYGNYIEKDYLVFERKRMVTLLNGDNTYDKLLSKELIEHCIKQYI